MKSPFEFGTVFGEVYLDTCLELPVGSEYAFRNHAHIRAITFQFYGAHSGKFCYLVKFQFPTGFDETALRSELENLAAEYAEQMNSVQDYEPAT